MIKAAFFEYMRKRNGHDVAEDTFEDEFPKESVRIAELEKELSSIQSAFFYSLGGRTFAYYLCFTLADRPFTYEVYFGDSFDDIFPVQSHVSIYDNRDSTPLCAPSNPHDNGWFTNGPSLGSKIGTAVIYTMAELCHPEFEMQVAPLQAASQCTIL